MQKVSQRQRFMLTLPGFMLVVAFLIGGGVEAFLIGLPTAFATASSKEIDLPAGTKQAAVCTETQSKPSFKNTVVVSSSEIMCGNVTSLWGNVIILGEVRGDVVAIGGNVDIEGKVIGNVTLYGGKLISRPGAYVNGDIHVCGGQPVQNTALQLHGNFVGCPNGIANMLGSDLGMDFHFWYIVTWVVLGMLLTTLLPEHVMMVRTTVKSKLRRSLALGLLSILLAPAILIVLLALIIPIPLAILVVVGLFAAWVLGMVAISWIIGEMILQKVAPQFDAHLMPVCVGLIILSLLGSLPYIGWFVNIGVGVLGIGAVFLSRFGTRLYSQPKQPLPW
jgi:hypothetical protein